MGFSSKNTGVDCHAFLQGIFLIQGLNLRLLHWQASSLPLAPPGKLILVDLGSNPDISSTDNTFLSLSELWELVLDRVAWHATIHGIAESDMTEQLN